MQHQSSHPGEAKPPPSERELRFPRSGANFKLFIGLVLAGLVVLFTLQNADVVQLRFLFWSWSMPRVLMIFGVLGVGIVLGWLLSSWLRRRKAA